jgi:hypothetical protein
LFNENVEIETFNTTEDDEEDARFAAATDMAFQIIRNGEEFHEKKAAIYLIANNFQFNVAKPPFAWHEHYFFHPKWSHLCQYCQP